MLREVLDDPRLELRFRLPESDRYVDARGAPIADEPGPIRGGGCRSTVPGRRSARSSTTRRRRSAPICLPRAVETAGLAIEIVRLRVELRRQLDEVAASRRRIVAAGDEERRRIERNLHDGAQQRLVSIGLALRHAQHGLGAGQPCGRDARGRARPRSPSPSRSCATSPRGCGRRNLTPGSARRSRTSPAAVPLPVAVDATRERFPVGVEAAAYFIACEALTNAAKHAQASKVALSAQRRNGSLVVWRRRRRRRRRVAPAAARASSGLADRVGAHGGTLRIESRSRLRHETDRGAAVRVLIAEDQVLLREGLARLFQDGGQEVVATYGHARDLPAGVRGHRPDLVVLDIRMPPTFTDEGARAAAAIKQEHPDVGVLLLSQHIETSHVVELVRLGGFGYMLKDRVLDVAEFLAAAERVAHGGSALDPQVVLRLISPAADEELADLSDREREILSLMAEGLTNTGIAKRLVLSDRTVEAHVRHVLLKLGIPQTRGRPPARPGRARPPQRRPQADRVIGHCGTHR